MTNTLVLTSHPPPRQSSPLRLIRPRCAKNCRHSLELNLLLPCFVSRHCICHQLTQPAGLASLHHSTGSMFFYGNAAGTAVWGLVQLSKKPHYFAHLGVVNRWLFLSCSLLYNASVYTSLSIYTCSLI